MSRFEDRLWNELAEQHGALLAETPAHALAPPRIRPRAVLGRRVPALAAAVLALAGALAAIVIGLGSHGAPAAYAVVSNPDGTVTVTITELAGVTGADAKLRSLGLPVRVVREGAGCPTDPGEFPRARLGPEQEHEIAVPSGPEGSLVIAPSKIPPGDTVVIGARTVSSSAGVSAVGLEIVVYEGTATPSCIKALG